MGYDFTSLPDRRRSGAEKFHNMRQRCPHVPEDVIPFSVADMDFLPPPALVEGLQAFIGNEIMGYTLPAESYYEAVLNWYSRRHGLSIPREWLLDVDAVIPSMRHMIRTFSCPGDEVLLLVPVYMPFFSSIEELGRQVVSCELILGADMRYTINFDRLEYLCRSSRAKILLFCNPHNPVGKIWSQTELEQVADICLRHQVFIISDEIHWDLILPGNHFVSMASLPEKYLQNCAINTAATKTFNVAALRGAATILPDEARRKQYLETDDASGPGILSYVACELGYNRCEAWLDELLLVIQDNRDLLIEFMKQRLPEVGVIPLEATYLQWLDFRALGMDAAELEAFMAEKAFCFFTEGFKFGPGGAGFERWNLACPRHVLLAGLERMEKAIRSR